MSAVIPNRTAIYTHPKRRNDNPPREILSSTEAAQFLGICVKTLIKLAEAGTVPHQRAGRKYLFHRETLELWVKGEIAPTARE